ncbi:MAG: YihY family inner membrane protein [Tannerellaceae bacterium]|jgi:membrane protein|nr:YihY family inner membrane protein [Tannerellaceae bacterium]
MKKKNRKSLGEPIRSFVRKSVYFITYEIWRITGSELSGVKKLYIGAIKTLILALRGFAGENLSTKASALTYSSLLAIVPLLAVLIGIAKGFGFQQVVHRELLDYFPGNEMEIGKVLEFVESYLSLTQGGVFVGVGLLLLFYTVIGLISSVEETFNSIWQVSKSRPWNRKVVDYMALFLILPVLMTVSGGFSIFLSTLQNTFLGDFVLFTPVMEILLKVVPFLVAAIAFTAIYILLPNTKVHFLNGLIPGMMAGGAFQLFQLLYINGQIWVSRYNAIYGSFAALPLLLLWLQLSWLICLFGAEVSYASQNVKKFSFERDSRNISRRYKDFLILVIASLIVKRFAGGGKPYTADELSERYHIPLRLTTQILLLLSELGIIIEVNYGNDDRITHYQPAMDIHQISVGDLLDKMDKKGSENFKVDTDRQFANEWNAILHVRRDMAQTGGKILLKDL